MNLTLQRYTPKKKRRRDLLIGVSVAILLTGLLVYWVVSTNAFANRENLPMTGEAEFDSMFNLYMNKDMPLLRDIMEPANSVGFFIMKLSTDIVSLLLLVVGTIAFASMIVYGLRPDLADEIHEIKMEKAGGQQVPMDEPMRWLMGFLPDIKAASGVGDNYEYERPTIGLMFRDNIWQFLILFTLAIALRTNLIHTFLIKTSGAAAYGVRHYVDNTDMRGIVNTWTTAGKDFNPRYDTLTQEGRNRNKTFNAMYNALKTEKPRDRTEAFLGKIGANVYNEISQLESKGVRFGMSNFAVSADILSHRVTPDPSDVKLILDYDLSQFMDQGIDYTGDRYLYVTILQYEDGTTRNVNRGASVGEGALTFGNNSRLPESMNLANLHGRLLSSGYEFYRIGNGQVTVRVTMSDGSQIEEKVTLNITGRDATANFNSVTSKVKITEDVTWSSFSVTGLTEAVGLRRAGNNEDTTTLNTSYIQVYR